MGSDTITLLYCSVYLPIKIYQLAAFRISCPPKNKIRKVSAIRVL